MKRPAIALCLCLALAPLPAAAQSWDAIPAPENSVIAAATWGDGTRAVVRCDAGRLTAFVARIGQTPGTVAYVLTQRRPDEPRGGWWRISADGQSVTSGQPVAFARDMYAGGVFDMVVKSRDLPDWETTLTLPSEPGPLAEVLSSCGVDPSAAAIEYKPTWAERPRISAADYPNLAMSQDLSGGAMVSCYVSAEGRPEDCIIIDEHPADTAFGYFAVQAIQRGKLNLEKPITSVNERPQFTVRVPFFLGKQTDYELPFADRVSRETAGMFDEDD